MNLKTAPLKLNLGKRSYQILIEAEATRPLIQFLKKRETKLKRPSKIYLVSDSKLEAESKTVLLALRSKNFEVHEILVNAGEGLKDIESVYPIYGKLLGLKADRDSILIALGGGSVGDAAGFVAATYMRGIDWVSIPTTLLAQVDSGVGGKTGINHESGKNLIGAFHQPVLVICATQFLKTLGKREVISGLGEIVKYALTFDPPFLKYLESRFDVLMGLDEAAIRYTLRKSLAWKCKAVSKDELDRTGTREVLNFGHTFAHALESATRYEIYQHGEAVILGMRFALALSVVRKQLKMDAYSKLDSILAQLPVSSIPESLDSATLFSFMKKDKKAEGKTIRFILLERVGKTCTDREITLMHLEKAHTLFLKNFEAKS